MNTPHTFGARVAARFAALPATFKPGAAELRAAGLGLAVKTVVSLVMLFFFLWFTGNPDLNLRHYTGLDDVSSWYIPFANWDGQHYLLLSDLGYNQDYDRSGGRQFYPLYPLLIRLLSIPFSPPVAALLLNYLFVAGACVFLYRLGQHFQCRRPHLVILLVMTFPTAFFTSAIYSEALFLFLMTGFAWHFFATRSRMRLVYLALLPLTRGTAFFLFGGLLLYVALAFFQFVKNRRKEQLKQKKAQKNLQKKGEKGKAARRRARQTQPHETAAFDWRYYLPCLPAFVVGVAAYFLFYAIAVGDPLAGIKAQKILGHGISIDNLFNPLHFVNRFLLAPVGGWFSQVFSLSDRVALVLMLFVAVLFFVVRKEWGLLCFYFPLIYGHAAMGIGGRSFFRYALIGAPFLALALVKNAQRPWLLYALSAAAFAVQLRLVYQFSLGGWVG